MNPIYTKKKANELMRSIYDGETTIYNLPEGLYKSTAKRLVDALFQGYGNDLSGFTFGSPDYKLLRQLKTNVYIFSGAKTATQIQDMQSFMYEDGKHVNWPEFKKKALNRFEVYNGKEGYLESEYITAQTAGQSAQIWQRAMNNKNLFTMMRTVAVIDSHTSSICEHVNGTTLPIDHPLWNKIKSPRHFRCRCYEELIDKYDDAKPDSESRVKQINDFAENDMNASFHNNPGKTGMVFKETHSYFDVARQYKNLAKKNFNLPIE